MPTTDQWHNECISYDPGQLDSGARGQIGESRICPYPPVAGHLAQSGLFFGVFFRSSPSATAAPVLGVSFLLQVEAGPPVQRNTKDIPRASVKVRTNTCIRRRASPPPRPPPGGRSGSVSSHLQPLTCSGSMPKRRLRALLMVP